MSVKQARNKNYMKQRRTDRKAAGLCTECAEPMDRKGTKCKTCNAKQLADAKRRAANRKALGLCYRCKAPVEHHVCVHITFRPCEQCYFKQVAKHHLDGSDDWVLLKELFVEQGGRCAYTGEVLILGNNASLDHIAARAKGGENHIKNYQWVTKQVNDVKRDLSHDEFINLCKLIAENN